MLCERDHLMLRFQNVLSPRQQATPTLSNTYRASVGILPHPVSPSASTLTNTKQTGPGHLGKCRWPQSMVNRCDWPIELWTLKLHHTHTQSEHCQRLQHTHSWHHCSDWLRLAEHLKLSDKWTTLMEEMMLSCLGIQMPLQLWIPPEKETVNMNDFQSYNHLHCSAPQAIRHLVGNVCKALN